MTVHVFGIDIGETVFHLIGLSKEGHIVVKKRFSRNQLQSSLRSGLRFVAPYGAAAPCLIDRASQKESLFFTSLAEAFAAQAQVARLKG